MRFPPRAAWAGAVEAAAVGNPSGSAEALAAVLVGAVAAWAAARPPWAEAWWAPVVAAQVPGEDRVPAAQASVALVLAAVARAPVAVARPEPRPPGRPIPMPRRLPRRLPS